MQCRGGGLAKWLSISSGGGGGGRRPFLSLSPTKLFADNVAAAAAAAVFASALAIFYMSTHRQQKQQQQQQTRVSTLASERKSRRLKIDRIPERDTHTTQHTTTTTTTSKLHKWRGRGKTVSSGIFCRHTFATCTGLLVVVVVIKTRSSVPLNSLLKRAAFAFQCWKEEEEKIRVKCGLAWLRQKRQQKLCKQS